MRSINDQIVNEPIIKVQSVSLRGGWHTGNMSAETREVYNKTIGTASNYQPYVKTKLCALDVDNQVGQQVTNGFKYAFQVFGCILKLGDTAKTCDCSQDTIKPYKVIVYTQPWRDVYEIRSVIPIVSL